MVSASQWFQVILKKNKTVYVVLRKNLKRKFIQGFCGCFFGSLSCPGDSNLQRIVYLFRAKSDQSIDGFGFCRCGSSLLLIVILIGDISKHGPLGKGLWEWNWEVKCLIFADDAVLLAPPFLDPQSADAAGMWISTSNTSASAEKQSQWHYSMSVKTSRHEECNGFTNWLTSQS